MLIDLASVLHSLGWSTVILKGADRLISVGDFLSSGFRWLDSFRIATMIEVLDNGCILSNAPVFEVITTTNNGGIFVSFESLRRKDVGEW